MRQGYKIKFQLLTNIYALPDKSGIKTFRKVQNSCPKNDPQTLNNSTLESCKKMQVLSINYCAACAVH